MTAKKLLKLYANRDYDFWTWREAVEGFGIDATLDALGYSKDRGALWYNEHTGSTETLQTLIAGGSMRFKTIKPREEVIEFAIALEDWLPQLSEPNPVIARSLALSDYDVLRQAADHLAIYAERNSSAEAFVSDVHSMGGTLPDGGYSCKTNGKVVVDLHDRRQFTFSLAEIYKLIRQQSLQPSLF
jgi:hypothetical protein